MLEKDLCIVCVISVRLTARLSSDWPIGQSDILLRLTASIKIDFELDQSFNKTRTEKYPFSRSGEYDSRWKGESMASVKSIYPKFYFYRLYR